MIDWPAATVVGPPSWSTMTSPLSTRVISSKAGACAGSSQPGGATMWATETASVPVFTRPTCSLMTLPPGTGMEVGELISLGMAKPYPCRSADPVHHQRQQVRTGALGCDGEGPLERLEGALEPLGGVRVQRHQPLPRPERGARLVVHLHACACLHRVLLAGATGAEPPRRHADLVGVELGQHAVAGRQHLMALARRGQLGLGVAALGPDHRLPHVHRPSVRQGVRGVAVVATGGV